MAAIISLKSQPVFSTSGITTSTYTVPAGKMAKVKLDCLLPTLNGVDLTSTASFASNSVTSGTSIIVNLRNVHKVNFTLTAASAGNADCDFYINQTGSDMYSAKSPFYIGLRNHIVFTLPIVLTKNLVQKIDYLDSIRCAAQTNSNVAVDITYLEDSLKELTLKTGDTIAFTSGRIQYEEYTL